jgi:erythronate-4-phosphate dehydrogenase
LKIITDDKIPFLRGALEPYAEVVYLPGNLITPEAIKGADALLIRTRTKCNASLLERSSVKFIGTATIGFDHIDVQYCNKQNIAWTNAPGCNSSSVQQYVAAALLKIANEFRFSLKDKTIGIVGVGNVGSKVEKFAGILGMRVLLNDPPRAQKEGNGKFVTLETILYDSDIITAHIPLEIVGQDKTYHLFGERFFKKMKKGGWFINSSRGEVSDTPALKQAVGSGKLGGAVIDVWENEPHIDPDLLEKAFIATPHIAGYSTDGKANGTSMVVNSLCRFFDLPVKNWYPENVPEPDSPGISIGCKGKSDEDIIREAVYHTYDIARDDFKLRFSPSDFEIHRGDYPLRREFPSYTVNLKDGTEKVCGMLEKLGFRVESLIV